MRSRFRTVLSAVVLFTAFMMIGGGMLSVTQHSVTDPSLNPKCATLGAAVALALGTEPSAFAALASTVTANRTASLVASATLVSSPTATDTAVPTATATRTATATETAKALPTRERTETQVPTDTPEPTAVPPTAVPPTQVPPTAVPPTAVPPTEVPPPPPPTEVPPPPPPTEAPPPAAVAAAPSGTVSDDPNEQAMFAAINATRAAYGLYPLSGVRLLSNAARRHSVDMASTCNFSHTGSDGSSAGSRITAAGYAWRVYGEALGCQSAYAIEAMIGAWLDSPGHREIILTNTYREIGVGYAASGGCGMHYWSVDMGNQR